MHNNILEDLNHEKQPYYIYAPSYIKTSAGVKALHLLCHHLNRKGYPAYLATNGEYRYKINPELITPILTQQILNNHIHDKKNPIVVYPDIVKGNPLNSKCCVRYLLHYAGFLGGDKSFSKHDLIFTYTKKIAQKLGNENSNILFLPICDTEIFYPPQEGSKREGSCFYASKYKGISPENKLHDLTKNSVEITRDLPHSQTTKEVADLLRKSECFYTYEDTSLITEALLCGCPVILIKNKYFTEPLAAFELGNEGCVSAQDFKNLEDLQKQIPLAQKKFFDSVNNFWLQLDNFIKLTQELSEKTKGKEINIQLIPTKIKRNPLGRILKNKIKSLLS